MTRKCKYFWKWTKISDSEGSADVYMSLTIIFYLYCILYLSSVRVMTVAHTSSPIRVQVRWSL